MIGNIWSPWRLFNRCNIHNAIAYKISCLFELAFFPRYHAFHLCTPFGYFGTVLAPTTGQQSYFAYIAPGEIREAQRVFIFGIFLNPYYIFGPLGTDRYIWNKRVKIGKSFMLSVKD